MFSYFYVSRTLVTGSCDRYVKRADLGGASQHDCALLPHSRIIVLREVEARQVASALKHLLASSMGMSHRVAHGGGFLLRSHMLVYLGRICQETGPMASLFSLSGVAYSFLPRLAQIPATCLQGSETLHRPGSHSHKQLLCQVPCCPSR